MDRDPAPNASIRRLARTVEILFLVQAFASMWPLGLGARHWFFLAWPVANIPLLVALAVLRYRRVRRIWAAQQQVQDILLEQVQEPLDRSQKEHRR